MCATYLSANPEELRARSLEKAPAFGENSAQECAGLLTEIVTIAREALDSNRELYVVESLVSFRPTCQDLGGCGGYGCKSEVLPVADNACHGENDECAHGFDCPDDLVCGYDQESRRWACKPLPTRAQSLR
jgi:hypothetical protein